MSAPPPHTGSWSVLIDWIYSLYIFNLKCGSRTFIPLLEALCPANMQIVVYPGILDPRNYLSWQKLFGKIPTLNYKNKSNVIKWWWNQIVSLNLILIITNWSFLRKNKLSDEIFNFFSQILTFYLKWLHFAESFPM